MTLGTASGLVRVRSEPWPSGRVAEYADGQAWQGVLGGGSWNGVDAVAVVERVRQATR